MPPLRSRTSTHGRNMAGARSLWRATGMTDSDFGKPIIAISNSYTQFVPGHVHLKDMGDLVASAIVEAGGVAKEFNTIAVDDGIAMGHGGMLYSLPSRDLIADSVEYMVNAHTADALVCISNCDKITPGMLNAALRLNIPVVFVSGGPMEAGKAVIVDGVAQTPLNLINAINYSADDNVSDDALLEVERSACPTCGSCSGMFTANSMNCLTEALGLSLPGNGSTLATHTARRELFLEAGRTVVELARRYYEEDDESVLPRSIATKAAFTNAMTLDVAMGGSTNTVLHILAAAIEGEVDFDLAEIDEISRRVPCLAKVAPNHPAYHMEDVHRAGGIPALLGELDRGGLLDHNVSSVHTPTLRAWLDDWDVRGGKATERALELFHAAPGGVRTTQAFSTSNRWADLDVDGEGGCIRSVASAYTVEGGLAVLRGNIAEDGAIIKTAGIDPSLFHFTGTALVVESQEDAVEAILGKKVQPGHVVVVRYEGPAGGPGMQEMLYPTSFLKGLGLGKVCALITDGRFSGGSSGISVGHVSPEAWAGGTIGLVEDGDEIEIDVEKRILRVNVTEEVLAERRAKMEASERPWEPVNRDRFVSKALQAYASMASSASTGAVRIVPARQHKLGRVSDGLAALPLPGDTVGARHRRPLRSLWYALLWTAVVGVIGSALLVAGALWLTWFTAPVRWTIAGIGTVLLLPVWVGVITPLSYRHFWYAVSPTEIDVSAGVLIRSRTVVPMNRVQHLRVAHGPVADRFRVATVHIHTAAGEIRLEDLDAGEADQVRARIAELAGLAAPDDHGDDV